MGGVLLQPPEQHWVCPSCSAAEVTRGAPNRFHDCPALGGLTAPMVPAGSGARVLAVERQDYVAGEQVQTDAAGRPVMAVVTERPDGSTDVLVLAPTARGGGAA